MLKRKWIPTPLVVDRPRPPIGPIEPESRFRSFTIVALLSRTLLHVWWMRALKRGSSRDAAWLVRRMLERLGGLWIKVGQLLSLRRDLFSDAFCDTLAELQDRASAFPFEDARRIIEADLGRPLDEVFADFDEVPFAAASVGQLHTAILRGRRVPVAVKVRRPTIAQTARRDLRLVSRLSRLAHTLNIVPLFRWLDFRRELDRMLTEELDYRLEASAMRDMRRVLKHHKGVHVPRVFREVLSSRVLVMEFVHGALMSDVLRVMQEDPDRLAAWLSENGVDRKKVGRRLMQSLQRQIFEDNHFHGDLHPGNIILLRDSRFALIDFGSVGSLDVEFHRQYRDLQQALAQGRYAKAADIFLLLAPELPAVGIDECKVELVDEFRDWSLLCRAPGIPFADKSLGGSFARQARILQRYRIPTNWTFMRTSRAQFTLDTSLSKLYPELDTFGELRRHHRRATRRRLRAQLKGNRFARDGLVAAMSLPALAQDAVEESFYNVRWARQRSRSIRGVASKASLVGSLIASGVAWSAALALVATTLLFSHQTGGWLPVSDRMDHLLAQVPEIPWEVWLALDAFLLITVVGAVRTLRKLALPGMPLTGVGRSD